VRGLGLYWKTFHVLNHTIPYHTIPYQSIASINNLLSEVLINYKFKVYSRIRRKGTVTIHKVTLSQLLSFIFDRFKTQLQIYAAGYRNYIYFLFYWTYLWSFTHVLLKCVIFVKKFMSRPYSQETIVWTEIWFFLNSFLFTFRTLEEQGNLSTIWRVTKRYINLTFLN
jgi:hypothetical protein